MKRQKSAEENRNKKGCLGLMLASVLFIIAVFAIIIYVISRPQTIDIKQQERQAIEKCWRNASDVKINSVSKAITEENCKEMEKQFTSKYLQTP